MTRSSPSAYAVLLFIPVCWIALAAAWASGSLLWGVLILAVGIYLVHVERRLAQLRRTVDSARVERREPEQAMTEIPRPAPPPGPAAPPAPVPTSSPLREPPPAPPRPERPSLGFDWTRTISAADLMGAKALAFSGGVVTLLGVLFFFVLAVNRGWVGPGIRVACGGTASALAFGCGLWLRRRYGASYSALTSVGVGIAGAYATLLAAAALYDMVPEPAALAIAAAIALVGVAVSLAWSSEIVAGFGLIGAMVVPATLVLQGGLRQTGTAFVAVVLAGTAIVAVRERWWNLLRISAIVTVPQALAQVAQAEAPRSGIVTLAAAFWLLYVGAGLAWQLRAGRRLITGPAMFLTGGALFAGISAALLFGTHDAGQQVGIALLIVAATYTLLAVGFYRTAREAATLLWALGLAVGAVGVAEALSGSAVTCAWAAEAALLAWLSSRARDDRLQVAALVYLGLAVVHALAFEAGPEHLFTAERHPGGGAPALVAIALAAAAFARFARPSEDEPQRGLLRILDPVLTRLRERQATLNAATLALAGLLTAYAASLGILELYQAIWTGPDIETPFEWGHVAVSATWALAGVVAVLVALDRRLETAYDLALAWLGVTVAKVVLFDVDQLEHTRFGVSLLAVATAVLVAGLARQLSRPGALSPTAAASIPVSFALALGGGTTIADAQWAGGNAHGWSILVVGVIYAALGCAAFVREGQRDLSTLLCGLGLAAIAVAEWMLLDSFWLVLAWTASAALLAGAADALGERRLQIASAAYLALGTVLTLADQAPPSDLLRAAPQPGAGVPSLLLVVGATVALSWSVRGRAVAAVRLSWTAGALAVYAASLAILEVTQRISPAGVHTDFQRGHTVVSAVWGLLGLVFLYVGLRRRMRGLRVGGFVLFAVSLGKIFLYDLSNLSSAQRAVSFLAVGAVLLIGGFFYQRLSSQLG